MVGMGWIERDSVKGTQTFNSTDLDFGVTRLTEAPDCLYVLESSVNKVKPNRAYHRLKVKVERPGAQFQARRGYFAPKAEKTGSRLLRFASSMVRGTAPYAAIEFAFARPSQD
jgi:hypothetical protein